MAADAPRMVKLISGEGHEYELPREAAEQSRTIRDLLQGSELQGNTGMPELKLPDIASDVLDLVVQYLMQKHTSNNTMSDFNQLKALDAKSEKDRTLVLELLLAADYLDC